MTCQRLNLIVLVALAAHWHSALALREQSKFNSTHTNTTLDLAASPTTTPGLNSKIVAHSGKRYWGVLFDLVTDKSKTVPIVQSDFGALTPKNFLEWHASEPSRGTFSFAGGDMLVNWAVSNGKMVRGHTLVWHSQLPSWVTSIADKTTLTWVIQEHISTVVSRYNGEIIGNCILYVQGETYSTFTQIEVLNEDGTLRSSVFSNVLGEAFITVAFQAARNADSSANLYINDYNLDAHTSQKVQGMVARVKRINASTRLIDGIGTEMHLSAEGAGGVQAALDLLASAGVDIAITQLEIQGAAPADYTAVVQACLATTSCVSITSANIGDVAGANAALWTSDYKPKPGYYAVLGAM